MTSNVTPMKRAPKAPPEWAKKVQKGPIQKPHRILMMGIPTAGKSSFAAGAPKPLFLDYDRGSHFLNVERLTYGEGLPATWPELLAWLDSFAEGGHGYETLVIDTLERVEVMCWAQVVEPGKSIESSHGGYGKGHAAAQDQWRVLQSALERVWDAGHNIILLAHTATRTFNDPLGAPYDRFEPQITKRIGEMWCGWVDFMMFARRESFGKFDPRTQKTRASGSGLRVMHTDWAPGFNAKQRLKLPDRMELSYRAFAEEVANAEQRLANIRKEIAQLTAQVRDPGTPAKVATLLAEAGDDEPKLNEIVNALLAKLEGQTEEAPSHE